MIKKTALVFLLFLFCFSPSVYSEEKTSGTIYYTDGQKLEFIDFLKCNIGKKGSGFKGSESPGIPVLYKNTWRLIPYNKIKSIEVVKYNFYYIKNKYGPYLEADIKVETVTGIKVTTHYSYFEWLTVDILDVLTNERKTQVVKIYKQENKKLLVKKIVFN